ncbi:hypothetical protein O6H91_06G072700 [Diphasiastrum complanatum]|nr:hypothetical protein O6H91_06G072700 [Diphasiastrum complanatum]
MGFSSLDASEAAWGEYATRKHGASSVSRRILEQTSMNETALASITAKSSSDFSPCQKVREHVGFSDACAFVLAHDRCRSGGLIDYTRFFFCSCKTVPVIGYILLALWLVALFYLLGNTAADFFCCSLEKLSKLLHLPPTVAGVSLLPLGNGAPDVFASIVAFVGAGAGQVGLNSVLGGAVFITSVVAGSVFLLAAGSFVRLDRKCFIRDISFFLFTLLGLCLILLVGTINLWGAVAFTSIYVVYGVTIAASAFFSRQSGKLNWHALQPMLDQTQPRSALFTLEDDEESWYNPLMDPESGVGRDALESSLPQWMWISHVAIFSHQRLPDQPEVPARPLWGWSEQQEADDSGHLLPQVYKIGKVLIQIPLTLPRKLTIPLVDDSRWSRSFAVASATFAPTLLALVWSDGDDSTKRSWFIYAVGAVLGILLGFTAFLSTTPEHPPRRFLFPWVFSGFLMSIVWFYIIAKELVAALVAIGVILEIDPAILGLTVLAWGNSIGDLVADLSLAVNGEEGVQIAVSGCYAGPMFNTLLGIGMSLVLSSWHVYPASMMIPKDFTLFYTLGFLVLGLLWVLIVLPHNRMQPSRLLGIGLLFLYVSFLTLQITNALGFITLWGST